MSTRGFLSHLDLNVADPERSIAFCALLLGQLGYERTDLGSNRAAWSLTMQGGGVFAIEVRPSRRRPPRYRHERYAPGIDHLAFHASSRAEVDQVDEVLRAAGYRSLIRRPTTTTPPATTPWPSTTPTGSGWRS